MTPMNRMSLEPSPNPYEAPQAPLSRSTADPRSWFGRIVGEWQRGAWPLVFMLNLVLPGLLGFQLCNNTGRVGMILATVLLLLLTAWFVADKPLLRARLIAGGKIVAVFQFMPFFHFLIGTLALNLLVYFRLVIEIPSQFNDEPSYVAIDFLPASLMTLMVGSGLLLLAFLLGVRQVSRAEEQNYLSGSWENS